jgi:hypothetical protein
MEFYCNTANKKPHNCGKLYKALEINQLPFNGIIQAHNDYRRSSKEGSKRPWLWRGSPCRGYGHE